MKASNVVHVLQTQADCRTTAGLRYLVQLDGAGRHRLACLHGGVCLVRAGLKQNLAGHCELLTLIEKICGLGWFPLVFPPFRDGVRNRLERPFWHVRQNACAGHRYQTALPQSWVFFSG